MLDYNLFGDADTNMFEKILLAVNGSTNYIMFRLWAFEAACEEAAIHSGCANRHQQDWP